MHDENISASSSAAIKNRDIDVWSALKKRLFKAVTIALQRFFKKPDFIHRVNVEGIVIVVAPGKSLHLCLQSSA